jgi:hypothetical protein
MPAHTLSSWSRSRALVSAGATFSGDVPPAMLPLSRRATARLGETVCGDQVRPLSTDLCHSRAHAIVRGSAPRWGGAGRHSVSPLDRLSREAAWRPSSTPWAVAHHRGAHRRERHAPGRERRAHDTYAACAGGRHRLVASRSRSAVVRCQKERQLADGRRRGTAHWCRHERGVGVGGVGVGGVGVGVGSGSVGGRVCVGQRRVEGGHIEGGPIERGHIEGCVRRGRRVAMRRMGPHTSGRLVLMTRGRWCGLGATRG